MGRKNQKRPNKASLKHDEQLHIKLALGFWEV